MSESISEQIRARLKAAGVRFFASDNLSAHVSEEERALLLLEIEDKFEALIRACIIDTENDHNTNGTSRRMAKMFMNEVFHGRYTPRPKATEFPNIKALDELYTVGPITVNSACSHHFVPIQGYVWIGVLPGDNVLGLSKFHRLTEWIMRRPHIQEEATIMLADELERVMKPKGLAVVFKAKHLCATWRGVKDNVSWMTTSVMRGAMRENPVVKQEFMQLIDWSNGGN